MFEDRLRFGFVGRKPALDHFLVRIVEAIVLQRALLQAREERLAIRAGKVEDLFHVDQLVHDLGLADVARNAVEHEHVDVGLEWCASTAASIRAFQSSTVISSGTSSPLLEYSRKARPSLVRVSIERKTSPQAQ